MTQLDFKYYDNTSDTPAISGLNFGTNAGRLCVLAAMISNLSSVSSLTLDGTSMGSALAGPTNAPAGNASWDVSGYASSPAGTGALNIAASMPPAGQTKSLLAASFDNIASVRSTAVVGSAGSASHPSATVTTVPGDIVVLLGNDLGVYDPTITGTGGSSVISGSGFFIGLMKTATTTSTTVSGTFSGGTHNWQGVVFVLAPIGGPTPPVISTPTHTLTAVNRATVGVTIDSGGTTGTLYGLERTGGSVAASSSIISGGRSVATTGSGVKSLTNVTLVSGTANQFVDLVYNDVTNGDSNVVTVGPITTASALSFSGTVSAQTVVSGSVVDINLSTFFSGTGFGALSYASIGAALTGTGLSLNVTTGHITGTAGAVTSVSGVQILKSDSGSPASTAQTNTFNLSIVAATSLTTVPIESSVDGVMLANSLMHYSWFPSGRIGSLTGITPQEGTATTDAYGRLTVAGLSAGVGLLLTNYRGAGISSDVISYHPLTSV